MEKIINLTPHELNIIMGDGAEVKIPPSGVIARVAEKIEIVGSVNGIPIIKKTFGQVEGLPDPQANVIYIASLLAAQAAKRDDVLAIGESVRNERGQVVGAKSLAAV